MPTLPQYVARQQVSGSVRAAKPAAVDVSGLAKGMSDVALTMTDIQRRQEEQQLQLAHDEAKVYVTNAASDFRSRWAERLQKARESADEGAAGFTATVSKEIVQDIEEERKKAPELARKLLEQRLAPIRVDIHSQAFEFETAARRGKLARDFDSGTDADMRTVFVTPEALPQVLASRLALVSTLGLPENGAHANSPSAAKLREQTKDRLATQAGLALTERDPAAILAATASADALKAHPVLSMLPPERLQQVTNHARALIQQRAAAAEREGDKALKEAEKAFEELRAFNLSGQMPDPGYQELVRAKTKGTVFESAANAMLQQAVVGAGFGSQTLPRQAAALRAIEAQQAQGTSPEAVKIAQQARAIHDTQTREYAENPWVAGVRFQRLPQVPEVPIADAGQVPQLVAERLKLMPSYEAAAGRPISPLQPKEAAAFAQKVQALPPAQSAEVLAATGAMLSAPQVSVLSEQMGKGSNKAVELQMKAASAKTTEGRTLAEFIARGAQGLKDKTVKRDDQALIGWKAEIAAMVRGTLGNTKDEDDVIEAAYYVRAAMDADGTAIPGIGLDKGNEAAVAMTIGQPIERAGVKMILPRGMKEEAFTEKLRSYTPERLRDLVAPPAAVEPGNIDLAKRPKVKNADGSISTVRSIGVNIDGAEVLIPTVSDDGRILSDDQAIEAYRKTGRHLGKFASPDAATAYAKALHDAQETFYRTGVGSPAPEPLFYVRGRPVRPQDLSVRLPTMGMKRDEKGRYIPVSGNALVTLDRAGTIPLVLDVLP